MPPPLLHRRRRVCLLPVDYLPRVGPPGTLSRSPPDPLLVSLLFVKNKNVPFELGREGKSVACACVSLVRGSPVRPSSYSRREERDRRRSERKREREGIFFSPLLVIVLCPVRRGASTTTPLRWRRRRRTTTTKTTRRRGSRFSLSLHDPLVFLSGSRVCV